MSAVDVVQPDIAAAPATADGLTEAEASRRLALAGRPARRASSRSYASIVRANVLTVFNLILAAFGVVTLIFGDARDALFLGIIVANSTIGITQEVRAKRAFDRLSLLVAPHATVRRDGAVRTVEVEQVVADDVVLLAPGDQVIADGTLLTAADLRLDESILTGESEPARRGVGEAVRSGAFVVEGTGAYHVTAVGEDSFAARITGEARSFRHPRSPLERAVNRLLYALVALVVVLGAVLGYSLYHRHVTVDTAVATSAAGVVTMIPEGLMVLVSLTYAAAAVRMSRRGVLAQQLNAIESLASVDTICVDKTGTLTEARLRVVELLPAPGVEVDDARAALATLAASASGRNLTLQAIADAYPAQAQPVLAEIPFSSRRRWSAIQVTAGSVYLGAPGRVPVGELGAIAEQRQREGRRVIALAAAHDSLPADAGELPPDGLTPLGLVVLAEELRPNVRDTVAFLLEQRIEIKVLSGDSPQTVAAIARDVGIPVGGVAEGSEIPEDPAARQRFAIDATVVGRISPEGQAGDGAGAQGRGPLRRDGRRRRQRRPRAEELAARDRARERHPDGPQRLRPRPDQRRLRERPAAGRRGPPRAAQPPARHEAVRDQVGVRRVPDPDDRDQLGRLPAAAAAPLARGEPDDRDPDVLPGARAEQRPLAARSVRALGRAVRGAGRGDDRHRGRRRLPVRAA